MTAVDAARRLKHRTYRLSLPLIRRGYELTEPLVRLWHQRFPYRYTPADFGDLFVAHHTGLQIWGHTGNASFPQVGTILEHESGWRIEVTGGNERHVTRLRLHPPGEAAEPTD